ncbi:DUF6098 family protein [Actinokineospora iranica]|uniref:Uncharacterized protein n=1 Tax=Actinokineospora iranica TaxID=1271860 RepID=A0A1G6KLB9_9PSEU|nr:DUF6098 family protein [Actinokineospora iranica]SDC31727.1 hypothetical protein SAMN05216174_101973 [Actinokineospora iranica]
MPDKDPADLPTLGTLAELMELTRLTVPLYLRYSPGPIADLAHPSVDHESGLTMPGHSANPLAVPHWWTLPEEDWLARRICQYLREVHEGARPWVLTGDVADFGPDNEPLLVDVQPLAWVGRGLVTEALERYHTRFDSGRALH